MKLSKNKKNMLYAIKKGYIINKKGDVFFKGKKRSLINDTKGYLTFSIHLKINNAWHCRRIWVHRLQAYKKYGKKMLKRNIHVRHINGDCKDNNWGNILIGSASQNQMDKPSEIRKMVAIKASYKNRRFSDEEIKLINEDRKNGMTYKELIFKYKTAKGTLSYLFNNALYNKKLARSSDG